MKSQNEIISEDKKLLLKSFPAEMMMDVSNLLERITLHSEHSMHGTFPITLRNEIIEIPTRIYWEEHRLMEPRDLNPEQFKLLSCILTRHHNGYVREKYLKYIIGSDID